MIFKKMGFKPVDSQKMGGQGYDFMLWLMVEIIILIIYKLSVMKM